MALGDFTQFVDTRFAPDLTYAQQGVTTYDNFTFSSAGMSMINKTGWTSIMVRLAPDIDNNASNITWASGAYSRSSYWWTNKRASSKSK